MLPEEDRVLIKVLRVEKECGTKRISLSVLTAIFQVNLG